MEPKKYTIVIDEYALDSLRDLVCQAKDHAKGAREALLSPGLRDHLKPYGEMFAEYELNTIVRASKFIDQFGMLLADDNPPTDAVSIV